MAEENKTGTQGGKTEDIDYNKIINGVAARMNATGQGNSTQQQTNTAEEPAPGKQGEYAYSSRVLELVDNVVVGICDIPISMLSEMSFPMSMIADPFVLKQGITKLVCMVADNDIKKMKAMGGTQGGMFKGGGNRPKIFDKLRERMQTG